MARDGKLVFWQTFMVSATEAQSPIGLAREPPQTPDRAVPSGAIDNAVPQKPQEIGGRAGPDPTRFGDWELRGRCIDF
jgi:hypothetical protein